MNYNIKFSKDFFKQTKKLSKDQKRFIHSKVQLIKINPYRFKQINSKSHSKVFRVRFSLNNKDTRLIYVVLEPNVIIVCLLDRGKDYKNLEKYLKKTS